MRYFLDTEFIERGPEFPLVLLSIGIVAEDGREFYAENMAADHSVASEWVKENVLVHLCKPGTLIGTPAFIADMVRRFVSGEQIPGVARSSDSRVDKPEFWGYYADYDWVLFAQLFGTMMDLPKGFPMYCRDIKQLCDENGNPKLPDQESAEHNALEDARWNLQAWKFLQAL